MITLGIRAAPKIVTYAIFDSENDSILNVEKLGIPQAFALPDALKFVRLNILDLISEYRVCRAGIRIAESVALGSGVERVQIESVIQESFASSDLQSYYVGPISSITAKVGLAAGQFKRLVDGQENYDRVDGWGNLNKEEREAVLCAIGAASV